MRIDGQSGLVGLAIVIGGLVLAYQLGKRGTFG